jgi:hypothetical protein
MTITRGLRRLSLTLIVLGAMSTGARAAEHEHAAPNDAHSAHAQHAAAKPLRAGQRWATDAPLRQGMSAMRAALEPHLPAIRENRLDEAKYRAIAATAEAQVGHIVANCKLSPDADAALHGVLAQVGEGTDAMAGKSSIGAREGALKLVAALNDYGRQFDHPRWKRIAL